MRKFALIGAVLFLIIPFAYISASGPAYDFTGTHGFLYTKTQGTIWIFSDNSSESFSFSWFESDNYYNNVFGDLWVIGVISLILTVVTAGLAFVDTREKRSGIMLLVASVLVLFLRLSVLNNDDLSFYSTNDTLFGETKYLELPLGPLIAIVFSLLDLKEK